MPNEESFQRLRDADAPWRAELKRLTERRGDWDTLAVEHVALHVAIKTLDLCVARQVVPRLEGAHFVTEVVVPPRRYPVESGAAELVRLSHGPVVVECEHGCISAPAALDLVSEALRASEYTRGWAPLFVRRWKELLGAS
jgi:hypothetical protein